MPAAKESFVDEKNEPSQQDEDFNALRCTIKRDGT
jgi:hypothetical protein